MYSKIVKMALALALGLSVAACGQQAKKEEAKPKAEPVAKVDLYVMSKCPYGVQAMDNFADVVGKLGDAVAVNIAYIGEEKDGKLESMHGETEVKGDTLELCAADLKPEKQLEFISCLNADWHNLPDGWEKCATKAGLDPAAMKTCADGAKGTALLKASFEKSQKDGAQGSPTIKIDGEDYKGGRLARDITRFICDKHGDKMPACAKLPPPATVEVIAITDPRCGEKCDPKMVFDSLKEVFAGLKTTVYNWGADPQAEAIAKEVGATMVPIFLFNDTLDKDAEGAEQMARWLEPKGKYKMLRVKPEFDPTAEICDNGKDDTGDGLVDCDDPTCKAKMACRAETPKTLEAFIMAQCPYGIMGVGSMKDVLAAFGKDMSFQIHYIAEEANGEVQSMHGPGEVEEDIRALCAAKLYGKANKYLDYVWCRGKGAPTDDWKTCCTGAIKADAIEKCATSDEGKNLLKEDLKLAKALDIAASPTWVVNGKTTFNGIAPADIQTNYCGKNAGLAGCSAKVKTMEEMKAEMGMGQPQGGGAPPPPSGGSCGQ
jgi:predicted DsbA family dithiol-disulfide isomerase